MSNRSDSERAKFLNDLDKLILDCDSVMHLSDEQPHRTLRTLGWFVLQNRGIIIKTLKRHVDFRTHEEWKQDEDDAYFDEEYD